MEEEVVLTSQARTTLHAFVVRTSDMAVRTAIPSAWRLEGSSVDVEK